MIKDAGIIEVDGKEYHPARECSLSRKSIEKFAEDISKNLNYNPEISNDEMVELIGGEFEYDEIKETNGKDGSVFIDDIGDFLIKLPFDTSSVRDRFTIAHEFGHYILHYLWFKSDQPNYPNTYATRYSKGSTPQVEWEANWFAAAFLMPESKVREEWKLSESVLALSNKFNVSISAASLRAKRLGLVAAR